MKFIHTSDLHIGKVVNGFSMFEEQETALNQIFEITVREQADAVFLCGDLYDRSVPPAPAVTLLDNFLTRLVNRGISVFAIAGNHDSGERLEFARRILEQNALYLEGSLKDQVRYVDMEDQWGTLRIHMIPFARPAEVRALFGCQALTYEECMKEILRHTTLLEHGRNVLLAHQFVVNEGRKPELSDSETRLSVGGTDQVDSTLFKKFDYTALGHIHGGQNIGGAVYYSGSPVKYSFSEMNHKKAVLVGELSKEGQVSIQKAYLKPIHDMRRIKGRLSDLISDEVAGAADREDYILAVLTNEEELIDPIGTLRSVYPNVMQLQLDKRVQTEEVILRRAEFLKEKPPLELFEDFYQEVMGKMLSESQKECVIKAIESAKEELK